MRHTWKKTAAFIVALMLVAAPLTQAGSKGGLFGGTAITAYAAGGTEVTQANVICQQYSYMDANPNSFSDTPPADITNIELADAQAFGAAVNCPTTYWVVVYAKDGDNLTACYAPVDADPQDTFVLDGSISMPPPFF